MKSFILLCLVTQGALLASAGTFDLLGEDSEEYMDAGGLRASWSYGNGRELLEDAYATTTTTGQGVGEQVSEEDSGDSGSSFPSAAIAAAVTVAETGLSFGWTAVLNAAQDTGIQASQNAGISTDNWYIDSANLQGQQSTGGTFSWSGGPWYPSQGAGAGRRLLEEGSLELHAPGRHLAAGGFSTGLLGSAVLKMTGLAGNTAAFWTAAFALWRSGFSSRVAAQYGAGSLVPFPVIIPGQAAECVVGFSPCPTSPDPGPMQPQLTSTCSIDSNCGGDVGCVFCMMVGGVRTCQWPAVNTSCTTSGRAAGTCNQGICVATPVKAKRYTFLVDSFFNGDKQHRCVDFKGNSAVRQAYNNGVKGILQEYLTAVGVTVTGWRASSSCAGAAEGTPSADQFKRRVRTQVGALFKNEALIALMLNNLQIRIAQNSLLARVRTSLGSSSMWLPNKFTYNGGRQAVCVNFPQAWRTATNCKPDHAQWRPDQITPY